MPVFINEVVFRGDVRRAEEPGSAAAAAPVTDGATRDTLIAEVTQQVTQAVIDYLERELDRIGER